jgi:hypothetical protein
VRIARHQRAERIGALREAARTTRKEQRRVLDATASAAATSAATG